MADAKTLGRVGVVGRFKPFHKGGALMLEAACAQSDQVIIGIGSCNKYNMRNPFLPKEVREMIDATLKPRFANYSFVEVPDFAHVPEYKDGGKWTEYVVEHFGRLDCFLSGNDYVTNLLKLHYNVVHPATLIPPEQHIWVKGAVVRMEMAKSGDWQSLVPKQVAEYLEKNSLVERFQQEFGLETLATLASVKDYHAHEDAQTEAEHTREKSLEGYLCQ